MKLYINIFKSLFFGILLSMITTAFAEQDISGTWKCKGYDPITKKDFSIQGEIKKEQDLYSLINWKNDETNEVSKGMAIHNQSKNSLAAIFWQEKNPENIGFGFFEIQSKDKIVGMWALKDQSTVSKEICERVSA